MGGPKVELNLKMLINDILMQYTTSKNEIIKLLEPPSHSVLPHLTAINCNDFDISLR